MKQTYHIGGIALAPHGEPPLTNTWLAPHGGIVNLWFSNKWLDFESRLHQKPNDDLT